MKRQVRTYYRIQAGLLAAILFGGFVLNLAIRDREISVTEKRELAAWPSVSVNRILSGKFGNDFETYASDQMAFREAFVCLKSDIDGLLGKKDSQGVYKGKNGFYIEAMEPVDTEKLGNTLESIRRFSGTLTSNVTVVLVPGAVSVYKEKLPAFAVTEDQGSWSNYIAQGLQDTNIRYLDLTETLLAQKEGLEKGETLYYRTDHHWTTRGAYSCLDQVRAALQLGTERQEYTPLLVSESFYGSLISKGGFSAGKPDRVEIYVPRQQENYLVTAGGEKTASLYSEEGLASTDPYTVFLGGNQGHVRIETEHTDKGRLLVFKDSYFNCFLPFLIGDYSVIDVVDPRYYAEELQTLMLQNSYDSVLYFYSLNNFTQDTSLSLVLDAAEEREVTE